MPSQNNTITPTSHISKCYNTFFLQPISSNDIEVFIRLLNSNKSTKSDCPPIKFLKISSKIISPIISKIFNICIAEGTFPKSLKSADIIPIFKKGDKVLASNYRPISLLSPFSKLFERHIYNQISKFITKNKILHKFQYGFRNNSSTEMALSQLCETLTNNIENKLITGAIFVDLAKAFDTVNHKCLLDKLYWYGIRGLPAKLLLSYLSDRTQATCTNGTKSSYKNVNCGVPQGSILGPLLFLLYINDLPNVSLFDVRLFADDACLLLDNKYPNLLELNINNELIKINNWMKVNKLSINYKKTNFMIFTRRRSNFTYRLQLEGQTLERVNSFKYLGVILSEKLSWTAHIGHLVTKISRASYIISKLRHYVDLNSLKMIYYSLVYPHLIYCITSWGKAPISVLQPLEILQRKLIRIMTNSDFRCHTPPLFHSLKLLTISDIYKLNLAISIHNIQNNKFTGSNNLVLLKDSHSYFTRLSSNNNYFQPQTFSNLGLSTHSAAGLKFWRLIPNSIKSKPLPSFKINLKKFLISYYV